MSEMLGDGAAGEGGRLLAVLHGLDQRCRANAAGLPQQEAPPEIWAGVLYVVGQHAVLSPLSGIEEVLDFPHELTRVPGARAWVRGIANNRGTLLPIFDLRAFLFQVPTARNPKNRVLVVRHDTFQFGLLVDDVIGIRHFEASTHDSLAQGLVGEMDQLLDGSFGLEGERYPILSLEKLGLDTRFNLAAA